MKRKNLKSLKLNKKSISSLDTTNIPNELNGGSGIRCDQSHSILLPCDDTSNGNCTTVETMTCANWSCTCPQK